MNSQNSIFSTIESPNTKESENLNIDEIESFFFNLVAQSNKQNKDDEANLNDSILLPFNNEDIIKSEEKNEKKLEIKANGKI